VSDLFEVADVALAEASGDEQIEAYVGRWRETAIRVYEGEVEQLSVADSLGVGVRLVDDHRQGFACCGTFDRPAVRETIAEARDNAAFAERDACIGLPEPDGQELAELDLWCSDVLDVSTEHKLAMAMRLERGIRGADSRISAVESCDYSDTAGETVVATTTGIRRSARVTSCELVGYPLADDADATQSGFGFSIGRSVDDLDAERAARDAVERTIAMLGAVKPRSASLTVVLDPWVVAQLVGIVAGTLSAEEVLKGRSLFAGRSGEQVADPMVTLVEDPTDPRAWGACPIDDEGLTSRRVPLVESGMLTQFVHSTWTARRMGTASTGSAVRYGYKSAPLPRCRAVSLAPGSRDHDDLVAAVDDGILVRDVSGLHSGVNPTSGDLSTGAQGLRIRHGARGEPLHEFTIGSTLQRLLLDVAAVGSDLTWLPMNAAGVTLVVDDVTISGR
jgi:PmbA protein